MKLPLFILSILVAITANCQEKDYSIFGGTSIIAIIEKDSIWIAADSKQREVIKDTSTKNRCKIEVQDSIAFAMAGEVIEIRDPNRTLIYDAYALMKTVLKKYKNLDSAVSMFNLISQKKIDSIISVIPVNSKTYKFYKGRVNKVILEIVLVKFTKMNLSHRVVWLAILENNNTMMSKARDMSKENPVPCIIYMGNYDEITKKVNSPDFRWDKGHIENSLLHLINLEIAANPGFVGPPVDIISISKNGLKWLTNNNKR